MSSEGSTGSHLACPHRVLLVEDNPGDTHLIAEVLEQGGGFRCAGERRLTAAIDRLSRDSFDVVLLDLGLPDSKGLETAELMLDRVHDVPVVILTGAEDDALGVAALRLGAEDFIQKNQLNAETLQTKLVFAIERFDRKQLLRRIVNKNVDAMVVVTSSKRVQYANDAARSLFGHDLVGSDFPYDVLTRTSLIVELEPPAKPRIVQMRVADVEWGALSAFLVSVRDITDLNRAQELERRLLHADRLAAVGQLAAGVAHEINNPATVVSVNVKLVRADLVDLRARVNVLLNTAQSELEPQDAELVQKMMGTDCLDQLTELTDMLTEAVSGVDRIASIVKELGAFSRIEQSDIQSTDVNEMVEAACSMAEHELRHRAKLVKRLGAVPRIIVDRTRLIQVLINLLINAAHAVDAAEGDREHQVLVETYEERGIVVIAVEDTGAGIPQRNLPHIFEPFFTTKPQGQGTGLGLSISAETVRRHNGELVVESEEGKGTRFEIRVPVETGLRTPPEVKPVGGYDPIPPATIVLIDDDQLVTRVLQRLLEPRHDVYVANTGDDGMELLAKKQDVVDVIFCDIMMPDFDGPEVYEHVKARFPELLDKMVFMTGGVFSERSHAFIHDVDPPILHKPTNRETLAATIATVVGFEREQEL